MENVGNSVKWILVGFTLSALSVCGGEPGYRIVHGEIVVDAPFGLEIGSTAYAKAFGDLVHTSPYANYDPETKTTTTNWHHYVRARLATPYFGCDRMTLTFRGLEKTFEECMFFLGGGSAASGKALSYAECRETVNKIAVDMEKRLGITMRCQDDQTEEGAKERIEKSIEDLRRRKERSTGFMTSFLTYGGERLSGGVPTDYRVSGMRNDKGKYSVSVSYRRHWESRRPSFKPGDRVPVYTNEMCSAVSGRLVPTREQRAAHQEARKLRETVNRLFGIDLDRPSETNECSSALWQTNASATVRREWMPLSTPFEGLTEHKVNRSVRFLEIPVGMFTLRRPFDGAVSEAELQVQAKRILDRLEKEYGAKIPEADTTEGQAMLSKMYGADIPTFGDTKLLFGLDKKQHFCGKVGDLSIEICSAVPRYEKRGDTFEIVCRGAIVVNVVQSPLITTGKVKK